MPRHALASLDMQTPCIERSQQAAKHRDALNIGSPQTPAHRHDLASAETSRHARDDTRNQPSDGRAERSHALSLERPGRGHTVVTDHPALNGTESNSMDVRSRVCPARTTRAASDGIGHHAFGESSSPLPHRVHSHASLAPPLRSGAAAAGRWLQSRSIARLALRGPSSQGRFSEWSRVR